MNITLILLKNWVAKNLPTYPKDKALKMTNKQLMSYVISIKKSSQHFKIRNTITSKENTTHNTAFSPVNSHKVKQSDARKTAAESLSTPLSIAINNKFKYNIFPSNAKVACVKPLHRKTEDKHCISNFQPVSIFNTFSKIY